MKKAKPLFDFTEAARRDIERCRLFSGASQVGSRHGESERLCGRHGD